jgi:RNA polymerase-binding transcription factor DksA
MTTYDTRRPALDVEHLDSFEHTLRAMARDRVPPLGNDETSAARHRAHDRSLAEALARIDDGTYGWCTWCGQRISIERLEVVPTASGCRACTEQRR